MSDRGPDFKDKLLAGFYPSLAELGYHALLGIRLSYKPEVRKNISPWYDGFNVNF
jgi:hypothetical protein